MDKYICIARCVDNSNVYKFQPYYRITRVLMAQLARYINRDLRTSNAYKLAVHNRFMEYNQRICSLSFATVCGVQVDTLSLPPLSDLNDIHYMQ